MTHVLRRLVLTALLIALAIVFGLIVKLIPGLNLEFPNGGNIFGFYILPLVLIGILLGSGYGVLGGVIYGIVSWMLDGYFLHWGSIILDYLIAFGLVGLSGALFGRRALEKWQLLAITFTVAFILRWLSHSISGVLFFSEYAGDMNVYFYSFIIYNLPYTLSSSTIAFILALLTKKQLTLLYHSFE